MFIHYDYDINYSISEPIKSCQKKEIIWAYIKVHNFLIKRGLGPKLQHLNSEVLSLLTMRKIGSRLATLTTTYTSTQRRKKSNLHLEQSCHHHIRNDRSQLPTPSLGSPHSKSNPNIEPNVQFPNHPPPLRRSPTKWSVWLCTTKKRLHHQAREPSFMKNQVQLGAFKV